jgi:hypothetical protein
MFAEALFTMRGLGMSLGAAEKAGVFGGVPGVGVPFAKVFGFIADGLALSPVCPLCVTLPFAPPGLGTVVLGAVVLSPGFTEGVLDCALLGVAEALAAGTLVVALFSCCFSSAVGSGFFGGSPSRLRSFFTVGGYKVD